MSLVAFFVCCSVTLLHFAFDAPHFSSIWIALASTTFGYLLWRLVDSIRGDHGKSAKTENLLVTVFENAAVGLALVDADERFEGVNQAFCNLVGYSREEILSPDFGYKNISLPEEYPSVTANARDLMRGAEDTGSRVVTRRYVHKSGRIVWVTVHVYLYRPHATGPRSFVLAVVDDSQRKAAELEIERHQQHLEQLISERTAALEKSNQDLQDEVTAHRLAHEALEASEKRFRFITENTGDVIWSLDLSTGTALYVSPSVVQLRGYHSEEYVGRAPEAFLPKEACEKLRATIARAATEWTPNMEVSPSHIIELDQNHKDGHVIHTEVVLRLHADESGKPKYALGVTRDITERRRREEEIRKLAFFDSLTQLPNRRMLSDRLEQAIERAKREGNFVALLFLDLDNFKPVNDRLGHEQGDWLLKTVAKRIGECLRPYDTAARLGGDEFVVLLPDLRSVDESLVVAERLRLTLQQPFLPTNAEPIQVSSSIGVALFPTHAQTERELLRISDEAMYRAKKSGRNKVFMLEPEAPRNFTPAPAPKRGASMVRLNWSPAYCSGDANIDREHRNLFELANALLDHCAVPDSDPREVNLAYQRLMIHIEQHFREEELQMQKWGFARYAEHAEVHAQLLQQARTFLGKIETQTLPLGEFVDFIAMDVVARHMLKYDRDYFSSAQSAQSQRESLSRPREEPSRPGHVDAMMRSDP